jgi:hypothetical protein
MRGGVQEGVRPWERTDYHRNSFYILHEKAVKENAS